MHFSQVGIKGFRLDIRHTKIMLIKEYNQTHSQNSVEAEVVLFHIAVRFAVEFVDGRLMQLTVTEKHKKRSDNNRTEIFIKGKKSTF